MICEVMRGASHAVAPIENARASATTAATAHSVAITVACIRKNLRRKVEGMAVEKHRAARDGSSRVDPMRLRGSDHVATAQAAAQWITLPNADEVS